MNLIFTLSAVISSLECCAAAGEGGVCHFHNSSDGSGEDVKLNELVEGNLPQSLFLLFIATLVSFKSAIRETLDSASVPTGPASCSWRTWVSKALALDQSCTGSKSLLNSVVSPPLLLPRISLPAFTSTDLALLPLISFNISISLLLPFISPLSPPPPCSPLLPLSSSPPHSLSVSPLHPTPLSHLSRVLLSIPLLCRLSSHPS
ncbi:unnamed protein product [Gadus morhua 'NCC']